MFTKIVYFWNHYKLYVIAKTRREHKIYLSAMISASYKLSGNFLFRVSGNSNINIAAASAIPPNVKYGNTSKY